MKIKNVADVVRWRLCVGCGACAYLCPEKSISLINVKSDGIRPEIAASRCKECGDCLKACPGIETKQNYTDRIDALVEGLQDGWGPILELWEGYASDQELRFNGSSGGAASALALYCIEHKNMDGVLHAAADKEEPFVNRSVLSRNRFEILSRTGSRYAPASTCDGLERIEIASRPCVFLGKPCDVAAVQKAQGIKPGLSRNIGIKIGIFCAGAPSTQGTLDLLQSLDIDSGKVEEIRYRGKGWPGKFSVKLKGEEQTREILTYMAAWSFLQKYRPYRCYLCPDGTSELADISVGDPWYRPIKQEERGFSLILVRTEKGRQILRETINAGYITAKSVSPQILENSQKNLLTKRGSVWGRLLIMKAFGIPTPQFSGFSLFNNWLKLPVTSKISSLFGTGKRIIKRRYYSPLSDQMSIKSRL